MSPKLRFNKTTKRYVMTIKGKDRWLGKDRKIAEQKYHRLLLEAANEEAAAGPSAYTMTIVEMLEKYALHMEEYYQSSPKTWERVKPALRVLRRFYGDCYPEEFGLREMRILRDYFIQHGAVDGGKGWVRVSVNRGVQNIIRFFRWSASMEYCTAEIYTKLTTLEPLRKGRSSAKESKPVRPVPPEDIEATKKYVSPPVAAMIDLQLCTGARPGEIRLMKVGDIDRSEETWILRLENHKTAHHGKVREIPFGPKARAILAEWMLGKDDDEYIFQPIRGNGLPSVKGQPRRPNQLPDERKTERTVGECYTKDSYNKAIRRGCKNAGVPHWHPHRLRHNAATELRKLYGVETAQVILGHSSLSTTQIYAEAYLKKVKDIAEQYG
jgi:integrase